MITPIDLSDSEKYIDLLICDDDKYLLDDFDIETLIYCYPIALIIKKVEEIIVPTFQHVSRPNYFNTIFEKNHITLI